MSARECADCGTPIGIRATRCKPCRRAYRTDYERERAQAARAENRERMEQVLGDQGDLMTIGSISDGRSIGGQKFQAPTAYAPRPAAPEPNVVDYTTAPGPRVLRSRPDPSGIPAEVRHDRVALDRMLAAQDLGHDDGDLMSEMTSWDDLVASNSRGQDDRRVTFPALGTPRPPSIFARPMPRTDYLGRSIPRASRWS